MAPSEFLGNVLLLIVGGNETTLIPSMVSEVVRWQSPVAHMCRTAMDDVEIGGKTIRKWDKVAIWYLSGNRDQGRFDNAHGFGYGIHRCLGNRLAEMQLRILWEEIMQRFGHVEVVGAAKYLNSSFIRVITELPVRVHDR